MDKIKCPICHGKGELDGPKNIPKDLLKKKEDWAKLLRGEGYSIREIMQIMNYKSPLSVQMLLKK